MSPHFTRVVKEVYGYKDVHYMVAGHKSWQHGINAYYTEPEFLKMAIDTGMAHILVDLRDPATARRGHIPGAVNFPAAGRLVQAAKEFNATLSKKLRKKARIIYYGDDPKLVERFHRTMRANYVENGYILNGGIRAWKARGYPIATGPMRRKVEYKGKTTLPGEMSIKEFRKLVSGPHPGVVILDVRSPGEWLKTGIVPGAMTIPLDTMNRRWQEVPRDRDVVVHCAAGNRALQAWRLLTDKGYTRVRWVNGKLNKWSKGIVKKGLLKRGD